MARVYCKKEVIPELSVVNNETGEIVSAVAKTTYNTTEEFIMCFLRSIEEVAKLDGSAIRVLMWCWKFSSFNSEIAEANLIVTNQFFKERIRREGCAMSDSAIDKAVTILNKKGLLIRQCRSTYILNPQYFFKGTLSSRSKIIRTIEYIPKKNESV